MKNAQLRRRCSNLRGASISDVKIANIQAWLLIPTLVIFATTCSGGIKFPSFAGNNPVPKKAIVGQDTDIEEEYKKCLLEFDKQRVFDPYVFLVLTEKAPDNPYTHMILGNALSLSEFTPNHYQKAIEEFDKAIEINPNIASVYVNRGIAHFIKNEPTGGIPSWMITGEDIPEDFIEESELAIKDFDRAIKLDPNLFSAYFNKGVILKTLGREKESIPCFEKAIKIGIKNKSSLSPTVSNEDDVEFLGTGHPMMAMSNLRKYLIDKKLGLEKKQGKIVRLSSILVFISNENDPLAFAYYHQGSAYASANLRDYNPAIECFNMAIEKNPNVPSFYAVRGVVYAGTGQTDKMLINLQLQKELIEKIKKIRDSEK